MCRAALADLVTGARHRHRNWKFEVEVYGQSFRSAGMGVAAEGLVAMQVALASVLDAGSTNQQQSQLWTEVTEADLDSDSDQTESSAKRQRRVLA